MVILHEHQWNKAENKNGYRRSSKQIQSTTGQTSLPAKYYKDLKLSEKGWKYHS